MDSLKQFLTSSASPSTSSNSGATMKPPSGGRRKSEVLTRLKFAFKDSDSPISREFTPAGRRYSVPDVVVTLPDSQNLLDTIDENNENYALKTSQMNLSSNQQSRSPKEKKFQFFRTRTLSNSSNESTSPSYSASSGGMNIPNASGQTNTSPHISPRSIFDRVSSIRKRSQSDAKGQPGTIDHVTGSSGSDLFQHQLQLHLQQQLQQQQQQQAKMRLLANGRQKQMSECISEERSKSYSTNDDLNELNDPFSENIQDNVNVALSDSQINNPRSTSMKMTSKHDSPNKKVSASDLQHSTGLITSNATNPITMERKLQHSDSHVIDLDNLLSKISNNQIFSYFMKHKFCYDIMPKSAKVVVFDTQLLVKKAFFALIYNGVRAAALWDSKNQKFVGMLTITDFILILQKYYRQPNAKIEELEEHKLETWRVVLKEYERPFIFLAPEDSLFEAVKVLTINRVHRLPIVDTASGNVVCIVTHKRILRYLYLFIYDMPQPQFLQKTIGELKLGTLENIIKIKSNMILIDVLNIFVSKRVSALPVVDENNRLVNIYSKFDVIDLAAQRSYNNLNITVTQALEYRAARFDGVATCMQNESLGKIMERIVNKEVHRLIIVDEEYRVTGIVSLSDILMYIILKQDEIVLEDTNLATALSQTRLSTTHNFPINAPRTDDTTLNGKSKQSTSPTETYRKNSIQTKQTSPMATINDDQPIFEEDPMETS